MSGNQWKNSIFSLKWFIQNRERVLHAYGKHGTFIGRRYRKGKYRCKFCGALESAKMKIIEFKQFTRR